MTMSATTADAPMERPGANFWRRLKKGAKTAARTTKMATVTAAKRTGAFAARSARKVGRGAKETGKLALWGLRLGIGWIGTAVSWTVITAASLVVTAVAVVFTIAALVLAAVVFGVCSILGFVLNGLRVWVLGFFQWLSTPLLGVSFKEYRIIIREDRAARRETWKRAADKVANTFVDESEVDPEWLDEEEEPAYTGGEGFWGRPTIYYDAERSDLFDMDPADIPPWAAAASTPEHAAGAQDRLREYWTTGPGSQGSIEDNVIIVPDIEEHTSLDEKEALRVQADLDDEAENFPGAKVSQTNSADPYAESTYEPKNPILKLMGSWLDRHEAKTAVDFRFEQEWTYMDQMEALTQLVGSASGAREQAYWMGRLEALESTHGNEVLLEQHGRGWALVWGKYKSDSSVPIKSLRAGFMDMITDLKIQRDLADKRERKAQRSSL